MSSTSVPSIINIAIIGGGSIGPRHAQSVSNNPYANLIALVDPAPHGHQKALSLGTAYYPSIALLLASAHRPHAAIICTPNNTHVPLSLELISAGVHVLVEKPISVSIPSGLELIQTAVEKNVKLLVGHHRRFNPYLLAAKAEIDRGRLGSIIAVQGSWCLKKPDEYYDGIGEWRKSRENGGVVLINLIHEVDLLQYLLGPIVQVFALESKKTRNFDAEEGAAIILKFESGVIGTFVLCDAVPSPWNFEAGTGENPTIPQVEKDEGAGGFYRILGTEGSLSVPDLTLWSYNGRAVPGWTEKLNKEGLIVNRENIPFDLQVQHLIDVVKDDAPLSCSGEEALRAMVVCEAVKKSMATGQPIAIDRFVILESSRNI
ncbi:hypothetical protein OIDMADRAFT_136227 [Oidiodendron maius Zn]|uniref:Gfo/Idh/MocA-like oxidoreductase N-terminal domain-containing protein n=1 Tax=Oidiodendron maius (strain Zn) TaxID=913774 RepID=A0A0C3GVJ4_OIDMZ|nr:hypothetical protein OIDMADRAFT_136227 [Oidiodendron maius Zn]